MKTTQKIGAVASVLLLLSSAAYAAPGHHDRGGRYDAPRHVKTAHPHSRHGSWVVPLVVGGAIGYLLSEPRRESVSYVSAAPAPVAYAPEPLYEERWVYFGDCDCQRKVLVRIR